MELSNSDQKSEDRIDLSKKNQITRIDHHYIIDEITSVISLKKGIFYSIKELLIRPGKNTRIFLREDRSKLVKPVIFVIFCSLIFTILQQLLQFDDGRSVLDTPIESYAIKIMEWVQTNYAYSNMIMSAFTAAWIKVFFRKYDYNYYEIVVLILFISGITMIIYSFFGILEALFSFKFFIVGLILGSVYLIWAIAQFYDGRKVLNYIKAFLAYLFGLFTFSILATGIGFLLDEIIGKS